MKKTLMLIAIAALAAGSASAQRGDGPGRMRGGDDCDLTGPGAQAGKAMRGPDNRGANRDQRGGAMPKELRDEIRDQRDEIRDLVGAIRVETDDARKAELTDQLRAKLGTVADRMQEHQQERLTQAEERLAGLKERIEYADTHRDELIEEQVQRLIAGERPGRPTAFDDFPYAKGGRDKGQGRTERGPHGRMPPPPEDDMPGDMPPPPPEEEPLPGDDMPPPPVE